MTPPQRSAAPDQPSPAAVRTSVRMAVLATLLLATFGSFGLSFGVMTACTNDYSCTVTACAPCATANSWVLAGWAAQAALLGLSLVLAVLVVVRVRPRAVRAAAQAIPLLGLALLIAAAVLATISY